MRGSGGEEGGGGKQTQEGAREGEYVLKGAGGEGGGGGGGGLEFRSLMEKSGFVVNRHSIFSFPFLHSWVSAAVSAVSVS